MPWPVGGKQCMRQDACSTAQQHTPSSSSPGNTGLFFGRRVTRNRDTRRYPARLFQNTVLRRHVTTHFRNTAFFAIGQHHVLAIGHIHPANLAADHRKKTESRLIPAAETAYPCRPNHPAFSFSPGFSEPFQRGIQKLR